MMVADPPRLCSFFCIGSSFCLDTSVSIRKAIEHEKTFSANQIDSSNFTENDKMILDYFIQHKNQSSLFIFENICQDLYPSNATIVRFVRSLDLKDLMN